ncbi:DEAD/DEAH box helicase [Mesobacillus jeotgali]|uniref:DEAD/DEAH box helicase n=1 Tax=Mesobacillus jeotgali TaxID=129985 RepID=UPI000C82CB04|nr:DEAD/DEAH box helicase [Mesobacillus jeotgali]
MPSILLEINEEERIFILSGDTDGLISNKRSKLYLKDFLNVTDFNSKLIKIPYNLDDKENILIKIQGMLGKYGFDEQRTNKIDNSLNDFFKEEKNFHIFSEKAKDIRNNKVDRNEFESFINSLTKNLKNRTLYGLQLLSAYHLAFSQNGCNFSVPGAGKTSIVYGAYSYLSSLKENNDKKVDSLLIIGPLSSFGPWESEYMECFGEKAESVRLSGISKTERINHLYSEIPAELTLMSYQAVNNNLEDLIAFLKKNRVMVVLDEAHKIKNSDGGITAQAVLELAKYSKSRVVLTGTPAPNGYEDLINLFKFIWPNKKVIKFKKYHLEEMSQNPSDNRIPQLISAIEPYFIRIKKSDLGIPKPINNPPVIVTMDSIQRNIYDFIESKYLKYMMENNTDNEVKGVLVKARMIRLMQAATNPHLLATPIEEYLNDQDFSKDNFIDDTNVISKIMNYRNMETPSKFSIAKNIIQEKLNKNEKVIVWMTFIQNMFDFQDYLFKNGINSKMLYGGIPVESSSESKDNGEETREDIIRTFHKENSPFKVIIANPFATSESISLHKVCHNAIYIERTFNAAQFIQSKDRIHRYGLKKDDIINYYYLVSENSIDETIQERLEVKENRMRELIENSDIPLFSLLDNEYEEDDIKVLIKNYVRRIKKI